MADNRRKFFVNRRQKADRLNTFLITAFPHGSFIQFPKTPIFSITETGRSWLGQTTWRTKCAIPIPVQKCHDEVKKMVSDPTQRVVSPLGNIFYINNVAKAIAKVSF